MYLKYQKLKYARCRSPSVSPSVFSCYPKIVVAAGIDIEGDLPVRLIYNATHISELTFQDKWLHISSVCSVSVTEGITVD